MVSTIECLTDNIEEESKKSHALALASAGFPVFPVYEVKTGICACGDPQCHSPAKHPRIKHGLKDATVSVTQIERWWTLWPDANIAVATGNGLLVVDIDGPTGEESLQGLDVPDTLTVRTGRGRHLWFAGKGSNKRGLHPGIDIRGEGGYVLAPPSGHVSGAIYQWDRVEWGLASAPAWTTKEKMRPSTSARSQRRGDRDCFVEGERNDRLFRRGCAMRGSGMTPAEIEGALIMTNAERCDPPLDDEEVGKIAASAGAQAANGTDFMQRRNDRLLLDAGLHPHAVVVYLVLRDYANADGICWPALDTIAQRAGTCTRSVSPALYELEEAGFIDIENRAPKSNLYTVINNPQVSDGKV